MSKELYDLPSGWTWTKVGEIAEVIRGASPRPKGDPRYFGGKIPWIMISDISREEGKYVSKTKDAVTEEGAKRSRYLKAGTLILSNSGTVCVPKILAVDGCIHDGFVAFPTIKEGIELLYLYHWFNYIRPIVIQENWRGITQVNLNTNIVKNLVVPLPPTNEQRRIVARVEALFAESKTVREALDKVPVLLRRFRQSVLAKAFRGELTQRDSNDEPAQNLLERIRQEKNKGKQTFLTEERELPTDLPELPETWVWTTIDEVAEIKMGQSPTGSSYNQDGQGFPLLNGPTEFGREHPTPVQWTTEPTKICNKGDLLICVRGNTTGKMNWADQSYCIGRGLAAISTNSDMVEIQLLFYYLLKETEEIMRRTTGSTFPNLQSNQLRKLPFPLAPYEEQKRLALKINECFSLADSIETSVKRAREQAENIDQAILAKAFRGELVPQDPNDEPVSILLQRMKAAQK